MQLRLVSSGELIVRVLEPANCSGVFSLLCSVLPGSIHLHRSPRPPSDRSTSRRRPVVGELHCAAAHGMRCALGRGRRIAKKSSPRAGVGTGRKQRRWTEDSGRGGVERSNTARVPDRVGSPLHVHGRASVPRWRVEWRDTRSTRGTRNVRTQVEPELPLTDAQRASPRT